MQKRANRHTDQQYHQANQRCPVRRSWRYLMCDHCARNVCVLRLVKVAGEWFGGCPLALFRRRVFGRIFANGWAFRIECVSCDWARDRSVMAYWQSIVNVRISMGFVFADHLGAISDWRDRWRRIQQWQYFYIDTFFLHSSIIFRQTIYSRRQLNT